LKRSEFPCRDYFHGTREERSDEDLDHRGSAPYIQSEWVNECGRVY
jgi:hypothetical protein